MGRTDDDEPVIRIEHLVDAVLIGLLVFFAVVLGDVLPSLLTGGATYLTWADIAARTPTGVTAFGLAFVFQWLRARGIDVLAAYKQFKDGLP